MGIKVNEAGKYTTARLLKAMRRPRRERRQQQLMCLWAVEADVEPCVRD